MPVDKHTVNNYTVNSKFSSGFYFRETLHKRSFMKIKLAKMAIPLCGFLILVNHALIMIFNVANMSFNTIHEFKIPKLTVHRVL